MRVHNSFLGILVVTSVIVGCGGGGGNTTSGDLANLGTQRIITTLANVDTGGAINTTLSNGRLYFSNYNTGEIESVAVTGGAITTHYSTFASFGQVVHMGNQIYALDTRTSGSLVALPDTSVDITRLSQNQSASYSTVDVVTDGTTAYWSEFDSGSATSHVVRVPLVPTGESPISPLTGASTNVLLTVNGIARIALNGSKLFVSEGSTGNIYKIDLSSGSVSTLATAIGTVSPHAFPLATAGGYLYAQVNNASIVAINESTGALATVVAAANMFYSDHIRSDGSAVYWNEMQGTNWVIRSYTPGAAQPNDVVSIPSVDMLYEWGVANSQVWWFTSVPASASVLLQKAPVAGGAAATVATLSTGGWGIVGDATDLYWLASGQVMRMPQTGGAPVVVSNGRGSSPYYPNAITLTAASVVWGGGATNGVMVIPKSAQPVVPTVISQAAFPSMQFYMTADASTLYWSTENTNPTTSSQYSWAPAVGTVNNLGVSNGNITRIFPYLNSLYLVRQTIAGWNISVQPNVGGPETVLVSTNTSFTEIMDAHVSNGVMYFTARDVMSGGGGVYAVDLTSYQLSTIASGVSYPNRLYVDSQNVYWSTNGTLVGGVYRTALSGGTIETLYEGKGCWDIVGDNNNIYWAAGWWIYSTKK